jgi:hemerythrin
MRSLSVADGNEFNLGLRKKIWEEPMFSIKWDDNLSVGVQLFDDQHKYLVGLLNKTYNACMCTGIEGELKSILNELSYYSRDHFAAEERLMEDHGYPELGLHKIEHGIFTERIKSIHQDLYETRRNPAITPIDVVRFLGNWLTDHIMKIDKRFGMYVAALEPPHDEVQPGAIAAE